MLAMIPSSLSHGGWLSENPNCIDGGGVSDPFIQLSSLPLSHHIKLESFSSPSAGISRGGGSDGSGNGNVSVAKKLKHNASERDRRTKMNSLFSYLRFLLPLTNQTNFDQWLVQKRMSNPATISRALKYIPELQQQVEGLRRKKQGLVTKINAINQDQQNQMRKNNRATWMGCSLCSFNWLSETQALLQVISDETLQFSFPQILHSLDEDGLLLLSASSFQSSDGRLFVTLLVQVKPNTPSRMLQEILMLEK